MTTPGAPQDGFASPSNPAAPVPQTIEQVLVDGEEPSQELLEEWRALAEAPKLSDEELTKQALDAPGADGDPRTPE